MLRDSKGTRLAEQRGQRGDYEIGGQVSGPGGHFKPLILSRVKWGVTTQAQAER